MQCARARTRAWHRNQPGQHIGRKLEPFAVGPVRPQLPVEQLLEVVRLNVSLGFQQGELERASNLHFGQPGLWIASHADFDEPLALDHVNECWLLQALVFRAIFFCVFDPIHPEKLSVQLKKQIQKRN